MAKIRYRLRIRRTNDEETLRKYPNLTAPYWPTLLEFETTTDLTLLGNDEVRDLLETRLQQAEELQTDKPLHKQETGDVVINEKGGGHVWRGTITIPDKHLPETDDEDDREDE